MNLDSSLGKLLSCTSVFIWSSIHGFICLLTANLSLSPRLHCFLVFTLSVIISLTHQSTEDQVPMLPEYLEVFVGIEVGSQLDSDVLILLLTYRVLSIQWLKCHILAAPVAGLHYTSGILVPEGKECGGSPALPEDWQSSIQTSTLPWMITLQEQRKLICERS